MVVVNVADIVAISVVGHATVTKNVPGGLFRKLVMSKTLNNQVVLLLRASFLTLIASLMLANSSDVLSRCCTWKVT